MVQRRGWHVEQFRLHRDWGMWEVGVWVQRGERGPLVEIVLPTVIMNFWVRRDRR